MQNINTRAKQLSNFRRVDLKLLSTVSSLFQPLNVPPKEAEIKKDEPVSKSQRLLNEMGIVRQSSPGMFTFLPLGLRSLEKLQKIVDEEMKIAGCQKLQLPLLTSGSLWKKTGRWDSTGDELMTVKDRHKRDYVLSPTHEEAITDLVATLPMLTYRQLPLKLYQMNSKFRDEFRPRFGLLRGREFIMKDLYTFDKTVEKAQETYDSICQAYHNIFQRLGVPFVKVVGATGNIGGLLSHEYHFPATIGEDHLKLCTTCTFRTNTEISDSEVCEKCGSSMNETKGIEVGHTFLLGTKYSRVLNALFSSDDGSRTPCQMGCYGLGISRIVAAAVEVMSKENEIRWPNVIAPFSVCVIAPKVGSKTESSIKLAQSIANQLDEMKPYAGDVVFDERPTATIGKKLLEAKRVGYPFIIVAGKSSTNTIPLFELHDLNQNVDKEMTVSEILSYLSGVNQPNV